MAKLYLLDGTVVEVSPKGESFTLQELYQHVCPGDADPIVQAVPVGSEILWCHEEGKLRGLPLNITADALYGMYLGPADYLVGNILITSQTEVD